MWSSHPAVLFSAIWLTVAGLHSLNLSEILDPLNDRTKWLVWGSAVAFVLGWLVERWPAKPLELAARTSASLLHAEVCNPAVGRRLSFAWRLFLGGIALEVVLGGGAPILSVAGIGAEILYTEFGLPGLHGLLNALFYACTAVQFVRILLAPRHRHLFLLAALPFAYPVFGLSRQGFISLLVQYFFMYLLVRRPGASLYAKSAAWFIVGFLLFGYLGDIRTGRDAIVSLAAPTFDYPDWLPSAFIWFYIYLCSPINNVNFNINIPPHYLPVETLSTFVPSFLREAFLSATGLSSQWELAHEAFNVSSIFQGLLSDFGVWGTITLLFFCSVVFSRMHAAARTSSTALLCLVVVLHGIALSFFTNFLFHLVFIFQMVFIRMLVGRRQP